MSLDKILLTLFLLSASIAYPAEPPVNTTLQAPASDQKQQAPVTPSSEPTAPSLPSSTEMTTSYEGAFVRMLFTLLGLVALVVATLWILRRIGKGQFKLGSGRLIHVVEKRALSPKTMLYIVAIGNKKILISESQAEVRPLSNYEELSDLSE